MKKKVEFQVGHYSLNEAKFNFSHETCQNEFKKLWNEGYLTYLFARAIASLVKEYDREKDLAGVCNNWFSNHTKTFFYESVEGVMLSYCDHIGNPELEIKPDQWQIEFNSILDWSTYVVPELKKITDCAGRKALRFFYRHKDEMVHGAKAFSIAVMLGMEKLGYKTLKEMEDVMEC